MERYLADEAARLQQQAAMLRMQDLAVQARIAAEYRWLEHQGCVHCHQAVSDLIMSRHMYLLRVIWLSLYTSFSLCLLTHLQCRCRAARAARAGSNAGPAGGGACDAG